MTTRAERLRELHEKVTAWGAIGGDPVPPAVLELLDVVANLLEVPRLPPPDVLGPGDRLLFTMSSETDNDDLVDWVDLIRRELPGVSFLFVTDDLQPRILRAGEAVPDGPA